MQIREHRDQTIQLAQKGKLEAALVECEKMMQLIEEEDLTAQMGDMYEIPARLYYHTGKLDKALEFAKKTLREINGFGVPGPVGEKRVEMMEAVIEQIEGEIADRKKGKGEGKKE